MNASSAYPTAPLAQRMSRLKASPIREILSVIDRPGMISFAGGLPATEALPALRCDAVPSEVLQYGASEGDSPLREWVAARLRADGLACSAAQVLILSGSQQGIDLVAKLFIDPGTRIAVESPTYLAALQVFKLFGANCVPFSPSGAGDVFGAAERPAFAYAIPTFQNPTGHCYSAAERRALAQACDESGVTLFEDDPYRDLVYDPCDRKPVCASLERASWIYQGSFSKSLAPGLRLGYMVASPDLFPHLVRLKQAADLHSNRVSQWLVVEQLGDSAESARVAALVSIYRAKRDAFAAALTRHFGDLAHWEVPAGGLFFWLRLAQAVDTRTLLSAALEQGVAFMPGEYFYADDELLLGTLRLNFSHALPEQMERGLAILATLCRKAMRDAAANVASAVR